VELPEAYSVLGVPLWASEHDVREGHRDIAKAWHPDRHQGDPRFLRKIDEKLRQANAAFDHFRAREFFAPNGVINELWNVTERQVK
jgi:curved DNA-binding protein